MRIKIEFTADSAAFEDGGEVDRILAQVSRGIGPTNGSFALRDVNGNTVGTVDVTGADEPVDPDILRAAAFSIGTDHGATAASWVELNEDNAAAFLKGIDDGDPAVLDTLPAPDLSGQFADGYTTRQLALDAGMNDDIDADEYDDILSSLGDAYDEGFSEAVEHEVTRRAQIYVPGES